jgi:hypothetical protein
VTIHTTPLYGIAYADTDTALADYPTVTQQAATTVDAALAAGGVVPPGAADLTAEASTRASDAGDRARDRDTARVDRPGAQFGLVEPDPDDDLSPVPLPQGG